MKFLINLFASFQADAWMNELSWEERTSPHLTRQRLRDPYYRF